MPGRAAARPCGAGDFPVAAKAYDFARARRSVTVPVMVERIFPRWAVTVGALHASGSRVRSTCRDCGIEQVVETPVLLALYGAPASLINRVGRCTVVGCQGSTYFTAYKTYGRMQIRLVSDPELIESIETLGAPRINAMTLRKDAGEPVLGPRQSRR